MRGLFTAGAGPDEQMSAKIKGWEKELEGLKSLRDIRVDSEEA
jgi:hypothetical protein